MFIAFLLAGMEIYPHINLDVFAGGMFPATQTLGGTRVDLVSYWLGFGLTWHFDPCSNRGYAQATVSERT